VAVGKRILTTFEAARYCCVDPHTIRNWILAGTLPAYSTPGGHRRIRREELDAFLDANGMPIPQDFAEGALRILFAGAPREFVPLARSLEDFVEKLEARSVSDGFSVAWSLLAFRPHLLLLSMDLPGLNALQVLRRVRASPETSGCRVVVASMHVSVEGIEQALGAGAQDVVSKPVDTETLVRILRGLFPSAVRRPKRR
jgi:excisionase family DNA binding protein